MCWALRTVLDAMGVRITRRSKCFFFGDIRPILIHDININEQFKMV